MTWRFCHLSTGGDKFLTAASLSGSVSRYPEPMMYPTNFTCATAKLLLANFSVNPERLISIRNFSRSCKRAHVPGVPHLLDNIRKVRYGIVVGNGEFVYVSVINNARRTPPFPSFPLMRQMTGLVIGLFEWLVIPCLSNSSSCCSTCARSLSGMRYGAKRLGTRSLNKGTACRLLLVAQCSWDGR